MYLLYIHVGYICTSLQGLFSLLNCHLNICISMTTGQTLSAEEDHVICSKAPEQLHLCVMLADIKHKSV